MIRLALLTSGHPASSCCLPGLPFKSDQSRCELIQQRLSESILAPAGASRGMIDCLGSDIAPLASELS